VQSADDAPATPHLSARKTANSVWRARRAGVARNTLRRQGYGESCPEDPARTIKPYEPNRRVEVKIVKTTEVRPFYSVCANASAPASNPNPSELAR